MAAMAAILAAPARITNGTFQLHGDGVNLSATRFPIELIMKYEEIFLFLPMAGYQSFAVRVVNFRQRALRVASLPTFCRSLSYQIDFIRIRRLMSVPTNIFIIHKYVEAAGNGTVRGEQDELPRLAAT